MFNIGVSVRLPLKFDVARLNEDLASAEQYSFSTHPLRYHDGTWKAINLIYAGGKTEYTHEGELGYGIGEPEATEVLRECPYFQKVIGQIPGKIKMARLSALPPGGRILRHHDPVESVDFNNLRIHIPLRSDPRLVVFRLGFIRQRWYPGETWYGDFTFPHSVHNKAPYTRVNIIVDLEVSEASRTFFPEDYFSEKAVARREWFRQETRSISWRINQLQSFFKSPNARV